MTCSFIREERGGEGLVDRMKEVVMMGQREVEGKNGPPFKILRFCHKGGVFLGCGLLRCCFLLVVFFL